MLLCFVAFFILSFILINPEQEDKNVDVNAEYIVYVSWPKELLDDVDVHIQDPSGNILNFSNRDIGLMHLDRDDLGGSNDRVVTNNGTIRYNENREVVTIRGFVPGEYIINIHMYRKDGSEPVPVTVKIDKLNPFKSVAEEVVTLDHFGQEETVCRMIVDSKGNVLEVNYVPKSLTGSRGAYWE